MFANKAFKVMVIDLIEEGFYIPLDKSRDTVSCPNRLES
jgi:hypothetical protein